MAKVREKPCKFYICEKNCSKGREGTFYHKCQTCNLYIPLAGSKPARTDKRKEKNNKRNKKELIKAIKEY